MEYSSDTVKKYGLQDLDQALLEVRNYGAKAWWKNFHITARHRNIVRAMIKYHWVRRIVWIKKTNIHPSAPYTVCLKPGALEL